MLHTLTEVKTSQIDEKNSDWAAKVKFKFPNYRFCF
jgi:hypothetical protein